MEAIVTKTMYAVRNDKGEFFTTGSVKGRFFDHAMLWNTTIGAERMASQWGSRCIPPLVNEIVPVEVTEIRRLD